MLAGGIKAPSPAKTPRPIQYKELSDSKSGSAWPAERSPTPYAGWLDFPTLTLLQVPDKLLNRQDPDPFPFHRLDQLNIPLQVVIP